MAQSAEKASQSIESNANEKCIPQCTFPTSVTWAEKWHEIHESYLSVSKRTGMVIDLTPVSCVHCKEQFSKGSFNAPFHIKKCEAMWILTQQRISKNMDRYTHGNYCLVSCSRCGIDVYSDRNCSYRVCFKCRHRNQLEAVRRCQARYKVKHEDRVCGCCKKAYSPKRSTAKYCSDKCRVQAHRIRLGGAV